MDRPKEGTVPGNSPATRLAAVVAELQTELNRMDRVGATALGVGTAEDLQLLRLLLASGPLRVGEIAKRRASSVTTASGRLDRLERKNLIRRERVEGDRRAMVAALTRTGTKAASTSSEQRTKLMDGIADDVAIKGVERLVEALVAAVDPTDGPGPEPTAATEKT